MAAGPATASDAEEPGTSEDSQVMGPPAELSAEDEALLRQLEQAIDTAAGAFDADAALAAGADPVVVADFAAAYEAAGRDVVNIQPATESLVTEAGTEVVAAAASCTGARGYTGF